MGFWQTVQSLWRPKAPSRFADGQAVPHVLTFGQIVGSGHAYFHGQWDEAWRHSRQDAMVMRRDCFLQSLMQERRLAVSSLNWHLEVPDEKDPMQVAVRDSLTEIIKGIRPLRRIIYSLTDAIWYGRYGVQVKWKWENALAGAGMTVSDQLVKAGWKGRKLAVERWLPVNGDKIGHAYDGTPYVLAYNGDKDELAGAKWIDTTYYRGLLLQGTWRDRFIIHRHEIDDADFLDAEMAERVHGVGVRDRVFWLDWLRREWLSKVCDWIDRVGLGVTVWYYTEGNDAEKAKVMELARKQSGKANIIWPRAPGGKAAGSGIDRMETPVSGSDTLVKLQEHVEQLIERYVVGQTLSSKSEGAGLGGTGVADLHADTKSKITAQDASNLGETLSGSDTEPGLVNTIQQWTYPAAKFPVTFAFDVEKAESKERLEAAKSIHEMGVDLKEEEVLEAGGFSRPTPGDNIISGQRASVAMPGLPGATPPNPFGGMEGQQRDDKPAMFSREAAEALAIYAARSIERAQPQTINVQPVINLPELVTHNQLPAQEPPTVVNHVSVPDPAMPVVNVAAPVVNVAAPNVTVRPEINVDVPEQPPATVEVKPEITVKVPEAKPTTRRVVRDDKGNIVRLVEEPE